MDTRLALILGTPIAVPEAQLIINQPKLKEISMLGEDNFFMSSQLLCIKKEMITQDKFILAQLNNFQVLMEIFKQQDKKQAVAALLQLLFPEKQILITPSSILLRESEETIIVDNNNFDDIQEVLRQVLCIKDIQGDQIAYNPANEKARKIMEKIMEGRRKVAEIKAKENKDSIISRYVSILTIGGGYTYEELGNMTLYQFFDLVERFSLQLNWDIDFKIRLAGGKPKKEPESWLKSLHENKK